LVYARFVRHRSDAQQLVIGGGVRVNRVRVDKCSHSVKPDDVLTIALQGEVRVVKVLGAADRRGSALVAQGLYQEVDGAEA
jgi:ribosome-associated heat shock protein Hsp15